MKIIGYGNPDRGDDAAGLLVAQRLREWGLDAREALSFLNAWEPGDDVALVDAVCSGREPGAIVEWDGAEFLERPVFRASTHDFGLIEAIGLARSLDRLPDRLRVFGIEGKRFDIGSTPSPEVSAAIEAVALRIAGVAGIERTRICLYGVVQGVGFRPFVYRLANELGLRGMVRNSATGLVIEVEGMRDRIVCFENRLHAEKPVAAVVLASEATRAAPVGYCGFEIRSSDAAAPKTAGLLPDLATCADCLEELFDPANRRFGYPFLSCIHCGPRYTIVEDIPYDRCASAMREFELCPECTREYHEPGDRRFHAQATACAACGPALRRSTIAGAAEALRDGKIVALKGIGGFQLLVDSRNHDAVSRLRQRKHREEKPFAVMMPSVEEARRYAVLSDCEERLLRSQAAPIVLVQPGANRLAPNVAPHSPYLGVMLPYSPLHHLLMRECGFPVVATSGNRSEEPIATGNEQALEQLGDIADLFLLHDRPISRPCDDSVVRVCRSRASVVRRARGYAPLPVRIDRELSPVLAVGGHLKNTVAIAIGQDIMVSQHIGDLGAWEARRAFEKAIGDLCRLYSFKPEIVACDLHPDYASTQWATQTGLPVVRIPHHHAHVAACAAENGLRGAYLGVAWDGAGYGLDGTIWGGEFFLVEGRKMERIAHLRPFRLPGAEMAAREGWRVAAGLQWEASGEDGIDPLLARLLSRGVNTPWTTSVGRLFDGVAAIAGIADKNRFEGQAAMQLEAAIGTLVTSDAYPLPNGDWEPMLREIPFDAPDVAAAKFHNALVNWIAEVAQNSGVRQVVLSGGVFQNAYLVERAVDRLERLGFVVYTHQRVPPNDGGISLGQAVLAGS